MIVTEEEAKTKWCPEVRSENPGDTLCAGPACMAWRWQDSLSPEQQRGAYGYCGKAGKP